MLVFGQSGGSVYRDRSRFFVLKTIFVFSLLSGTLGAVELELECYGQVMLGDQEVQPLRETIRIDPGSNYVQTAFFESWQLTTEPIKTAYYLIIKDRLRPDSLGTYFYISRNTWKYNYSLVLSDGEQVQVVGRCEP